MEGRRERTRHSYAVSVMLGQYLDELQDVQAAEDVQSGNCKTKSPEARWLELPGRITK